MQRTIFILLPCLLLLACHKNSGPVNGNSVQPNNKLDTLVSFTADINGKVWHTDSADAYLVKYSNDSGVVNITINATKNAKDTLITITLNLTNFTGPGTYSVTPPVNAATYYFNQSRHYASSGIVHIISDSSYALIGTFSIIADTDTITNGVFNVAMP